MVTLYSMLAEDAGAIAYLGAKLTCKKGPSLVDVRRTDTTFPLGCRWNTISLSLYGLLYDHSSSLVDVANPSRLANTG